MSPAAVTGPGQVSAYLCAVPIKSPDWYLRGDGDPAGEPEPSFPQFRKDGWKEGAVVGAVVARVAAIPRSDW